MNIDADKLAKVLRSLEKDIHGFYMEASVDVGVVDGIVYRVQAISEKCVDDLFCPEWAKCVTE